jgi:hypothetical protein
VTVTGYPKGLMAASLQPHATQLAQDDAVDALMAYIQTLR